MPVRSDRGELGRGAGLLLALATTLALLAPGAARAAELPLVDQAQQQLSQTVQATGTTATEQVANALPTAARRAVAQTPVGDLARRVPRSGDAGTAAATPPRTRVDTSEVEATAGDAVAGATGAPVAGAEDDARQTAPPSAPPASADAREPVLRDAAPRATHAVHARSSRRSAVESNAPPRAPGRIDSQRRVVVLPPVSAVADRGGAQPPRQSGSHQRRPAPTLPDRSGATTGVAAGVGFSSTGLAVLVAALGLGASRWLRRLTLARVGWRPRLVVGVLERPG